MNKKVTINCLTCKKPFQAYKKQVERGRKYCSIDCYKTRKSIKLSTKCPQCGKIFHYHPGLAKYRPVKFCSKECAGAARRKGGDRNCLICGSIFYVKLSTIKKGGGKFCSNKCHDIFNSGINCPTRKDGRRSGRNNARQRQWRSDVLKRDNYRCVDCQKVGGTLHTHHIHSYAKYPKLRYEVDNGITVCLRCHARYHPNQEKLILSNQKKQKIADKVGVVQ